MTGRHLALLLACCLLFLAALAAVLVWNAPLNSVLLFGLFLVCPLLHLWMMRGEGHGHASRKSPTAKRD